MKINQPLALNEQGIRENQEDSVWPAVGTATEKCRTFAVCDGMGGHESGEVASNAVCTALSNFVAEHPQGPTTPAEVEQAIAGAYDMLDRVDNSAASHRMGTTLTLLSLSDSEAICAHIGDSRIYQVRPAADGSATIVYKSSDHSLVNELVKANVITAEEALTHPKKNVITRAMQSIEGRRDAATLRRTNNVASGDYFLMCTDGVTEAVSDQAICEILADRNVSDEVKLASIKALCLSASHDNFSLYLVPVSEGIQAGALFDETSELIIPLPGEPSALAVEAQAVDEQEVAEALDEEIVAEIQPSVAAPVGRQTQAPVSQPYYREQAPQHSNPWKKVAFVAIGVIVLAVVVFFAFTWLSKTSEELIQPEPNPREDVTPLGSGASDLDESTFENVGHRQGNKEVVSDSREDRSADRKDQEVKLSKATDHSKTTSVPVNKKETKTPGSKNDKQGENTKQTSSSGNSGGSNGSLNGTTIYTTIPTTSSDNDDEGGRRGMSGGSEDPQKKPDVIQ